MCWRRSLRNRSPRRRSRYCFFFQAEDGIRDLTVTGVQTCALPILNKKDGYRLLKIMNKIAKKRVIILTPNGFVPQTGKDNELQEHLSGWSVSDFRKMGFKVLGRYGLKNLRKEKAELKYKPKVIWSLISEASNILYTKNNPKEAYSLLCYKDVK